MPKDPHHRRSGCRGRYLASPGAVMASDQSPQGSGLTVPHPRVTDGIVHGISRTGPGTAGALSAAPHRSPARAVRPAPAPAAGQPGAAAVRGGRAGTRAAAAADHRSANRSQQPGDRDADRGRLRRPGAGQHHLLAAVPGRAVGLLQPVAPAEPVPRRPDRVADVRAGRRRLHVLGHRGPGHRQQPGGVGDRASRRSGRRARRPRPDPGPAGEGLRLHPAGADPFRHRRPRPRHPGRSVPPGEPRTAGLPAHPCRRCAGPSPGRTGRPSCSNSTCTG
jgi:hypothetical protein